MSTQAVAVSPASAASPLRPRYFAAAAVAILVMIGVIVRGNDWTLNFIHVMAGCLWTGIDLFMGFIVGPILRRIPMETRRAVIAGLVPRTLVLMPTLSIITGTAGWFLAERKGYLALGYPEFYWVLAALVILTILTIQGLGILLPTNLRLYFETQKAQPDFEKIGRWMRIYVRVVAFQGTMQVAIMVVMARFVTGL
ncbi:MAG: hypothetical protein IT538_04515 [Variibacter sp.]|nr:hypothetical protein [Variibacter sp.]